ncbi:MAG TPA: transporter, partial [Caldimonas sp.]|nr:transporter [Caldimonas sp.]
SAKLDVIAPYSHLAGSGVVAGELRERDVKGFGDPRFRLSVNFYGAPALSLSEFPAYKQDLVAGASVQVSAPWGQYDSSKAVNLGTHRWSIKPDIGFSKAFSPFTVDFTAGATFFGRNDDFFGGQSVSQDVLYSTQANVTYDFGRGLWAGLGATYYWGGRTTVNQVPQNDALNNSRIGLTVALPIDRYYSVKLNVSSGISTRTGTSFDIVGVVLQYRWGAGL